MRPASVFLQPVRENLVSFAQQTKEANFISKKMFFLFCFSEKGNVLCTKFLFLQKSAQMQQLLQFPWLFSCYRLWFTTYNSRWVYFLLLLSKFYFCPSLFRNVEGFYSWCSFLDFPYVCAYCILLAWWWHNVSLKT